MERRSKRSEDRGWYLEQKLGCTRAKVEKELWGMAFVVTSVERSNRDIAEGASTTLQTALVHFERKRANASRLYFKLYVSWLQVKLLFSGKLSGCKSVALPDQAVFSLQLLPGGGKVGSVYSDTIDLRGRYFSVQTRYAAPSQFKG